MGKISPVSAKYIINAHIDIDGVVDRPDVIGAIFGQTEGLLGAELELRELQRSGRIGRISGTRSFDSFSSSSEDNMGMNSASSPRLANVIRSKSFMLQVNLSE